MTRDELARHLYIHSRDDDPRYTPTPEAPGDAWWDAQALWWDDGQATRDEVAGCYAEADQMIRDGEATR